MAPALFWRSARHHHDEFFATESRADIEYANGSAEDLGNVAYDQVACHMSKSVVDALEAVQIDHQQRDWGHLPDRSLKLLIETCLEISPVEQAANGVDHRRLCVRLRLLPYALTTEGERSRGKEYCEGAKIRRRVRSGIQPIGQRHDPE
jgi:hypothetical protein